MLIKASWAEKICTNLGIEGVSQLWGDKPAWYFWISGAPGVYLLELVETGTRQQEGFDLHQAAFSLKCYPFAGNRVFQSFSFEEQCLIRSKYFDHTNTPHFDHREKIAQNLFNIAKIECVFDSDETIAAFTFESLDTWRVVIRKGTTLNYPLLDKQKKFETDEVDRWVPGTEIGYLFFDRLLSLYSFFSKKSPAQVLSFRSRGFEYVYDKIKAFVCVDSERVKIYTTSILYNLSGEENTVNRLKYIENELKDENEETLYDNKFAGHHFDFEGDETPHLMPLNHRWWSLAGEHFSCNLASSCGCS